jgi:hypothetical protein
MVVLFNVFQKALLRRRIFTVQRRDIPHHVIIHPPHNSKRCAYPGTDQ